MLLPCKNTNTLIIGGHGSGGTMMLTEAIKRGEDSFIIAAPDTCRFPVYSHLREHGYVACVISFGNGNVLDKSDPLYDAEWVCRDDKNVIFINMQDADTATEYLNRLLWAVKDIKNKDVGQLSVILDDPIKPMDSLIHVMEEGKEKGISVVMDVHSSNQFGKLFGDKQRIAASLIENVVILKPTEIITAKYITSMFGVMTINPEEIMELEPGKAMILDGETIQKACIYHA